MSSRFDCGTIVDKTTEEAILNNQLYVVDSNTQKIRAAKDMDEWLTCQVVLVSDYHYEDHIPEGVRVRCWIVYVVV
jgi:hypothetical protein